MSSSPAGGGTLGMSNIPSFASSPNTTNSSTSSTTTTVTFPSFDASSLSSSSSTLSSSSSTSLVDSSSSSSTAHLFFLSDSINSFSNFFCGIVVGYSLLYGGYYISRSTQLHDTMQTISSTIIVQPLTILYKQLSLFTRSTSTMDRSLPSSSSSTVSSIVLPSSSVILDVSSSPQQLIETLFTSSREQQVHALRIIHTLSTDPFFQEKCRTYKLSTTVKSSSVDTKGTTNESLFFHLCTYIHQCYNNSITIPLYQLGLEITANFGSNSINHSVLDSTGIITLCINNLKKALIVPHTLTDIALCTGALRTLTHIALSTDHKGISLLLYQHSLLITLLIEAMNNHNIDKNPVRLQCLKLIQIFTSTDEGIDIFRPLVQKSVFLTHFYTMTIESNVRDTTIRNGILNGDEILILELSILSSLSLLQKDILEYTGNGIHIMFRNGSPERLLYNKDDSALLPYWNHQNTITGTVDDPKKRSNSSLPPIVFTSSSPPSTPSRRLILAKLKQKPTTKKSSSVSSPATKTVGKTNITSPRR